jgi:multiple sugar transport system permease protein
MNNTGADIISSNAVKNKRLRRRSKALKISKKVVIMTARYIMMISLSVMILYPLLRMISTAMAHPRALGLVGAVWVPPLISSDHLRIAWAIMDPIKTLPHTFLHVGIIVVLQMLSAAFAGYAFARLRFRGMKFLFILVLITFIIPNEVFRLPHTVLFQNFDLFGLVSAMRGQPFNLLGESTAIYVLAAMGMGISGGLFIFIFRQFFRGIPKELMEAAYVDGSGVTRAFFRIILPMGKPAFFTVGTLSFIWNYNDIYFLSFFNDSLDNIRMRLRAISFIAPGGRTTVSVWINNIARPRIPEGVNYIGGTYGHGNADAAIVTISTLITILPLVILFLIIQRQFVEGVERSGIVG